MSHQIEIPEAARLAHAVLDEVEKAIIGKREVLELLLLALLADGHALIEDYPGLAKTLMARSFAQVTDLGFSRVQFTPDLMPMDITGSSLLHPGTSDLVFREGPIFSNLLLADEVNRAPAKTQAALLEAMQERQVTADGMTHNLDRPFLVIATQNPIEYEGTYPLPEAQVDRFLVRIRVGYPSADDEHRIVSERAARGKDEVELDAVINRQDLLAMQGAVEQVHISESVSRYIIRLVAATRTQKKVLVGASPRGSLALMKLARARALVAGRDFVTPDDVKAIAVPALSHRLILRPEMWVQDVKDEDLVQECLAEVSTPPSIPEKL